jgi:hypothetical protein
VDGDAESAASLEMLMPILALGSDAGSDGTRDTRASNIGRRNIITNEDTRWRGVRNIPRLTRRKGLRALAGVIGGG